MVMLLMLLVAAAPPAANSPQSVLSPDAYSDALLLDGRQQPWADWLKQPEFREAMLLALADRRQIGQWVVSLRRPRVDLGDETSHAWRPGPDKALTRASANWQSVRVCDAYANQLATVWGLPECWLGGIEADRDEVARLAAEVIGRYGQRIGPSPDPRWTAAILLPRLDRLATPDDVSAGRAVFSLPRDKAVRRVELPAYPTRCRWPWDAYDAGEGLLWQAEERLEGGRWRRYLGYVGSRGVARVPAEAIELVDPSGQPWTPAGDGWEARLVAPEPSTPTVVTLWLRNSRAVPAAIDEVWLRVTADGVSALRRGVRLRLECWPEATPDQSQVTEVKDHVGFPDEGRLRYLEPGESFIAGRLDLRRFCHQTPPGTYDLSLLLRPQVGVDTPQYASTRFVLPASAVDPEH